MAVHFAWMTELGVDCRHEAATAAAGHAVVHTDGPWPHVQLSLHGLRRLSDRRPPGLYFYEAWYVPRDGQLAGAISLGMFNADSSGRVQTDLYWHIGGGGEAQAELPGNLLLVTAQRNDGDLRPSSQAVLLGVIGPAAATPAVVALRRGGDEPAPVTTVSTPPAPSATETAAPAPAATPDDPALPPPAPTAAVATVLRDAPAPAPTETETAPERPLQAPAPPVTGWTFPVTLADVPRTCPPGHRLLSDVSAALIPLLPELRGTAGNMTVQFEPGQCLVTLRGVPVPAVWGDDAVTMRPYNVYQAWLRRGRGDEQVPLGFFRRIHHDTYRLHYRGNLPLHAFDTLAVYAADRAHAAPGSGPLLYVATYRHTEPVNGRGS